MRTRIVRIIVLLAVTVLLGAILTASADETPQYGGVLRIVYVTTEKSINVCAYNRSMLNEIAQNFYEPLFGRDENNKIIGVLCESWSASEDGLVHTLKLRPNVTFHDGTAFNAEVVKWNFDRMFRLKQTNQIPLLPLDRCEVVDDMTVNLVLTRPSPDIYAVLGANTWSMYSPTFVESAGDDDAANAMLALNACGTGPFIVEEFIPNEVLRLKRNPNYWQEGLPYLDGIVYQVVPDINTRAMMLETGEADIAMDLSMPDTMRFENDPDMTVFPGLGSRQYYMELNNAKGPCQDVRIRQAINYAVDKQAIIDTVYFGRAWIARSPVIAPWVDGFADIGYYEYNPDKARQLLDEAGWKMGRAGYRQRDNGEKLLLSLHTRKGARPGDLETAEYVQAMLKDVGIAVSIVVHDTAAFMYTVGEPASAEESVHDMLNMDWGCYSGDAAYTIYRMYRCFWVPPIGSNRGYFCDEEVERLADLAMTKPTLEERNVIFAEIQQRAFDQAGWLVLYEVQSFLNARSWVHGCYHAVVSSNWPMKQVWMDK
jgi:ABC-type transport system substrate-binding protein